MKKIFRIIISAFLIIYGSYFLKVSAQDFATDSVITYYIAKINPDSIQSYMQSLEDFGTRFCLAPNRKLIATWIKEKFHSLGYEDVRLDSFPFNRTYGGIYYQTWQYNVICRLDGYSASDSVFILGAHYDAIVPYSSNPFLDAPGADDNASGVAATLEIARVMKDCQYQPAYHIEFIAFAAEELGLLGSYDYAAKCQDSGKNIICMINNDMVSYCTLPQDQWKVSIQKYANSDWYTNLAHQIIENLTILDAVESTQYIYASDSWPFYQRGYKAIFFIENQFTPYYHTVNDLVASTNKYYAAEMVKISLGMLVYLNGNGKEPYDVPEMLNVADTIIASNKVACFDAIQNIFVAGNGSGFLVQEGGYAQFISGGKIVFQSGTTVVHGGALHARITTDSTFCSDGNYHPVSWTGKSVNNGWTDQISFLSDLHVFPNPSTGIFTISTSVPTTSETIIEICNPEGICLMRSSFPDKPSMSINISDRHPGIYFVRMLHREKIQSVKIIKF